MWNSIGKIAFRSRRSLFSATIFDAFMVGLARQIQKNPNIEYEKVRSIYDNLIKNEQFMSLTKTASSVVIHRIELVTEAFKKI